MGLEYNTLAVEINMPVRDTSNIKEVVDRDNWLIKYDEPNDWIKSVVIIIIVWRG